MKPELVTKLQPIISLIDGTLRKHGNEALINYQDFDDITNAINAVDQDNFSNLCAEGWTVGGIIFPMFASLFLAEDTQSQVMAYLVDKYPVEGALFFHLKRTSEIVVLFKPKKPNSSI